ncbi:hypothetical protein CPC08DRAFT_603875, partial [Agrocybe pediades]
HNLPIEPSEDTFSFFVVYMSHHISPRSVNSYLSGISQQLEPYFPNVRQIRTSKLVSRTLRGCMRLKGTPTRRKSPLHIDDLGTVIRAFAIRPSHDDLLFVAMLLTGFFGLMRLGELTVPDDVSLRNPKKIIHRNSLSISDNNYQFLLPSHKADRYFEGNRIIITSSQIRFNPVDHMRRYVASRDHLPFQTSALWITSSGNPPHRSFFINRLRVFFGPDIAGQSMRSDGATSLAENGTPPSIIQ